MDNNRRLKRLAASLAVAALLVLLPSLLSLPAIFPLVLAVVNRQLPGSIEVQACSLGWLEDLRCENLRYHDPALGLQVQVPRVTSDKGLLALLLAPSYLGNIILDHPGFVLSSRSGQPEKVSAPARPWWDRLSFRLKVNGGLVMAEYEGQATRELARDVDLSGSLATGTVEYVLSFRSSQGNGHLRAEGFVNLPTAGQSLSASLISRAKVDVGDLELAGFLDLAAARSGVPRGQGVLNGTCTLNASGIDNLDVRGDLALEQLQLFGGFLGQDRPAVDHLTFSFKGSRGPVAGWRLTTLALHSDPLRFEASGHLDRQTVKLDARGTLNLPAMAAQVPHLLALHHQTTLRRGAIDFSLQVNGTPAEFALKADCRTDRLEAEHGGRPVVWDTPLNVAADAEYGPKGGRIRALRAQGLFFEASGSGGDDDFSLRASADLGRMFEELAKVFAFDVQAKGRAELSVSSQSDQTGGQRLESLLKVQGLALAKGEKVLLPSHDATLGAKIEGTGSFFRDGGLRSVRVEGAGWPGTLHLAVTDLQAVPLEKGEAHCSIEGDVDLQRLGSVIDGLRNNPLPLTLAGRLAFAGSGQCSGRQLSLERLDGRIEQLTIATAAGPLLREPKVRVALDGGAMSSNPVAVRDLQVADSWQDLHAQDRAFLLLDAAAHRLEMRHLRLQGATRAVDAGCLLDIGHSPQSRSSYTVRAESEAALLGDIGRRMGWMAPGTALQGLARTSFAVRDDGAAVAHDLDVVLEPFGLYQGGKKVFSDPRLALTISLLGEGDEPGVMKIPAMTLQSGMGRLEGAGVVHRRTPPLIELQGHLTPNYGGLAPLWPAIIGGELALTGSETGTFLLSAPFILPLPWDQVTFAAGLPLESLRFRTLVVPSFTLPVELNRGRLQARIDAPLNGGTVALHPQWQWQGRRATMSLPPDSQVLLDVPLQRPLLDGLLGRIHPLFGTLTQPEGTVSVRLDNFSWLRGVKAKDRSGPEFKAAINVKKPRFRAKGPLRTILETAGLEKEKLRLQELDLTCESKEGRITCSPLRLLAGDNEIMVSGSMGVDESLEYLIQLPLTKALTEQANVAVHGEVTVAAEVTGSRTAPMFDRQTFIAGLAERLSAAQTPQVEEGGSVPNVQEPTAAAEQ